MPFPAETYVTQIIDPAVRAEFQQLYSLFFGYLSAQHKQDGSHAAVTADSVAVTGNLSVGGDTTLTGALSVAGMFTSTGLLSAPSSKNAAVSSVGGGVEWTGATLAFEQNIRITSTAGLGTQTVYGATAPVSTLGGLYRVFNACGQAVVVSHESATELTAANRYACPDGVDAVIPDGGSWIQWYDTTSARWRVMPFKGGKHYGYGRTTADGEWTSVAFSAGNFTGNGSMTWTVGSGDQTTFAYTLIGKTMIVALDLVGTSVGGTPNTILQVTIPGGFTAAKTMFNAATLIVDNGSRTTGSIGVAASSTIISIVRTDAANFSASADNTSILAQITFEVQ